MLLYVVRGFRDYEGFEIIQICSNEKMAIEVLSDARQHNEETKYDYIDYSTCNLDERLDIQQLFYSYLKEGVKYDC